MKKIQVLLLWVAVSMMPWIALARTDAFYEQRLKAGKDALAARRGPEAIEELRIAVFGFIDEPGPLAESLVYLAIAQNGVGRTADLEATLTRFVDSEKRAAGYDRRSLPGEVRVQFESLLTKQFAAPALASIPSLAPVVSVEPSRTAPPPAVPPVIPPASTTPAAPAPTDTRQAQSEPATTVAAAPTTTSPARPPQNDLRASTSQPQPSTAQQAPTRIAAAETRPTQTTQSNAQPAQTTPPNTAADPAEQARQMIATRRASQAIGTLGAALEKEPQRRELRLLLLQAAAMTSDWKQAMTQIGLLRPFSDNEPVFMFYGAVAMWESGRAAEARELLDRALPRLNRTPYVESYVKKMFPDRTPS